MLALKSQVTSLQFIQKYITNKNENERFCYDVLQDVSRSFAMVIQQLPLTNQTRLGVCIFYLVLRGLDSVEDSTQIPYDKKLNQLINFHELLD